MNRLGGLRVTGGPAGATVKVTGEGDFEDEGGLPWEVEGIRSGMYRVEVLRTGYETAMKEVRVDPGVTADVEIRLAKVGGEEKAPARRGGIDWVTIPGGVFDMGSNDGVADGQPVHRVRVPPFQMARTEVTVSQYRDCMTAGACSPPGNGDSCNWGKAGRDDHPVNCVVWKQAVAFSRWVGGRLPSEAEWEYAARSAGRTSSYPWGEATATCGVAVMDDGSGNGCGRGDEPWRVCSKPGGNNAQGVCDLAGNVWEWVQDWYHKNYEGAPVDGTAWERPSGALRALRSGSWRSDASRIRASFRGNYNPTGPLPRAGFRPVRSVP